MTFSPTDRQTSPHGFTLTEMMVAMAVVGVVGLAIFSVLVSTMTLSSENAAENISNFRARQTIDRIGQIVRYAQDTPVLINSDGTTASGTTSDGILVKHALGGPYLFFNSNGQAAADIPSGATSFMVEYAPSAGLDTPKVGDCFLLALSTAPQLEVATVTVVATAPLAKVQITTTQGITETASPGSYSVTASRYRKEAYVFVQSGNYWTLRHYPGVVAATNYANASSYVVAGVGFQKLGTQAWFTTTTDNGAQASWLRAVARSSDHPEYADSLNGLNTFTTMPLQIKLWNYNAPPPAQ
jgi:prepilin-type N-terminal cleavage/methylation domain-containing protein